MAIDVSGQGMLPEEGFVTIEVKNSHPLMRLAAALPWPTLIGHPSYRFSETREVRGRGNRFKFERAPPQSARRNRTADRTHKKRRPTWEKSNEKRCCNLSGRIRVRSWFQFEASRSISTRKNKDCGIKKSISTSFKKQKRR